MNLIHKLYSLIRSVFLVPVQPSCKIETISCHISDLEFRYGKHHLTANNPVRVYSPEGYFRECRRHLPIRDYIEKISKEFFFEIAPICYKTIKPLDWKDVIATFPNTCIRISGETDSDLCASRNVNSGNSAREGGGILLSISLL
jgi:hypothetical protein